MPLPRYFLFFVAALVALAPLAIDTYLPALPTMADAFGVDIVTVNNTISAYLFGFAAGQIIGGPVSDQIGRRAVGMSGLTLFAVASVAILMTGDATQLIAWRSVQAFGGGFAAVICMAMIRDSYPPAEAAKQFPKVMLVMLTAPLVAPGIGAALLPLGWQSIFVFLTAYALIMLLAFTTVPETANQRSGKLRVGKILPQYWEVLSFRVDGRLIPLRWIAAQGTMGSLMLIFITNSPFVYLNYYDVGEEWFVFYFGANVVGMFIGTSITTRLIHRVSPFTLYTAGRYAQLLVVTTLVMLVLLTDVPVLIFTPLLALAIGCGGLISPTVQGMYLAPFGHLAGSASSLLNVSTFFFGSVLGAISGVFYDGSLMPILLTMFGALIIGNSIAVAIPRQRLATG